MDFGVCARGGLPDAKNVQTCVQKVFRHLAAAKRPTFKSY